jgi:hypothetical protein
MPTQPPPPKPVRPPRERFLLAIGHPLRISLLSLFAEGIESRVSAARKLDLPLNSVSYHARVLDEECGFLEYVTSRNVRGATERFYRLKPAEDLPVFKLVDLPEAFRADFGGSLLDWFSTALTASMADGAVSRNGTVLVARPMTFDARGWKAATALLGKTLVQLERIEAASRGRLRTNGSVTAGIHSVIGLSVFALPDSKGKAA